MSIGPILLATFTRLDYSSRIDVVNCWGIVLAMMILYGMLMLKRCAPHTLTVGRDDFSRMLGSLEDLMAKAAGLKVGQ